MNKADLAKAEARARANASDGLGGELRNGVPYVCIEPLIVCTIGGDQAVLIYLPNTDKFSIVGIAAYAEESLGYDLQFDSLEQAVTAALLMSSTAVTTE